MICSEEYSYSDDCQAAHICHSDPNTHPVSVKNCKYDSISSALCYKSGSSRKQIIQFIASKDAVNNKTDGVITIICHVALTCSRKVKQYSLTSRLIINLQHVTYVSFVGSGACWGQALPKCCFCA